MSAHTPGPWKVIIEEGRFPRVAMTTRDDLRYSDGSGDEHSASRSSQITVNVGLCSEAIARGVIKTTREACAANARLIAASPELLAEAERQVEMLRVAHIDPSPGLVAAIAKARGGK